jgi:hypothetical protein
LRVTVTQQFITVTVSTVSHSHDLVQSSSSMQTRCRSTTHVLRVSLHGCIYPAGHAVRSFIQRAVALSSQAAACATYAGFSNLTSIGYIATWLPILSILHSCDIHAERLPMKLESLNDGAQKYGPAAFERFIIGIYTYNTDLFALFMNNQLSVIC